MVHVTANGDRRTEVKQGDTVHLAVSAEVPPGMGTIISAEWDFDGAGTFPFRHDMDGSDISIRLTTTHVYAVPGTYFATARVTSNREGKIDAEHRRLPNLDSARIVVT